MNTLLFIIINTILSISGSPYEISIMKIDGQEMTLAGFENKRIIVMTFNASDPDNAQIHFLDSLQVSNDSLQVICVPAINGSEAVDTANILAIQQTQSSGLIITMPGRVERNAGSDQQKLMEWLTDVNKNKRFNMDGRANQHFLISPSGILYGALDQGASTSFLKQVLVESYTGQ